MSRASGSRSRSGCSSCRRRKRRCDEEKPVCQSCRRLKSDCVYPITGSASNPLKFVVATSPDHYIIPVEEQTRKPRFLHLSSHELGSLCPRFADTAVAEKGPGEPGHVEGDPDVALILPDGPQWDSQLQLSHQMPRHMTRFIFNDGREPLWTVEAALMQYYAEVVSSSKVYVQTDRNSFRTSVMPRVLFHQGPLLFTVLAMSAAEWGQNSTGNGRDYRALSARYKVQALHELQLCLSDSGNSEENLLTCVLLASLEIAEGSRPTWLRHLQGALALLDNFSTSIDPAVAKFAVQYFRFRYILLETTQPKKIALTTSSNPHAVSYHHAINHIAEAEYALPLIQGSESLVDEHIGCSMELVDIINQTSALSLATDPYIDQDMLLDQCHTECERLERRLLQLSPEIVDMSNDYLLKSAESFRVAAQIYLRLTCLDASITQPSIVEPHKELLSCLSDIIVEGESRRSFPMWPLFIAGCACFSDEQRKTVLGLFSILASKWPISNISAVWKAVRTVWHTRDLAVSPASCKEQDWQDVIHRFGWKLSLS
ncbi:fungal-specific transcription factor domain-containing protein [Ilyonectria robusta]|uniref:fungal-specific transcription factor domain-containing protein n=1 Tax=Ilyonectria robusta TaxID=1079257 RepID=UPI001E8DA8C2|nr:fungal-specific transcription factor domain-containing protein [Ilyonectria robusta]KAH8734045.1 fungal-specific transcription factor domain-containing protein [Ilyonectria robusta]